MSAMVYKARRDESGAVVVDWVVADTLDDLSAKIAEGWVTDEAKARAELPDVGAASEPEPSPATEEPAPSTEEPASEPKSRKSAKKK